MFYYICGFVTGFFISAMFMFSLMDNRHSNECFLDNEVVASYIKCVIVKDQNDELTK